MRMISRHVLNCALAATLGLSLTAFVRAADKPAAAAKPTLDTRDPKEAIKTFQLAPGYEINLFASEVEFPDLKKPVAMSFDPKGRLWVSTMPSYPQYSPGIPANDKILIFEDTNADGKADTCICFLLGLG